MKLPSNVPSPDTVLWLLSEPPEAFHVELFKKVNPPVPVRVTFPEVVNVPVSRVFVVVPLRAKLPVTVKLAMLIFPPVHDKLATVSDAPVEPVVGPAIAPPERSSAALIVDAVLKEIDPADTLSGSWLVRLLTASAIGCMWLTVMPGWLIRAMSFAFGSRCAPVLVSVQLLALSQSPDMVLLHMIVGLAGSVRSSRDSRKGVDRKNCRRLARRDVDRGEEWWSVQPIEGKRVTNLIVRPCLS